MLITRDIVKQKVDQLSQEEIQEVANFIAFLKFRNRRSSRSFDLNQLALLQTEFAEEDRALAEVGISDYTSILNQEDNL